MSYVISSNTFDASLKTITLDGNFPVEKILSVINLTRKEVYYTPVDENTITATFDGPSTIVVLSYDTTTHNDTDSIQIIIADVDPISSPVTNVQLSNTLTDFNFATETTLTDVKNLLIGGIDVNTTVNVTTPNLTFSTDSVDVSGSTIAVTGTFWQTTQPVSFGALPAGTNVIGAISNTGFQVNNFGDLNTLLRQSDINVSFSTVPTVNIGTIGAIATESTLSGLNNKIPANLTVTTNRLLVDTGLSQALTDAQLRQNPIAVTGTFYPETQPVSLTTIPLANDAATATKQEDLKTLTGALTETAPSADTVSSGLNGRLQRIAQRVTSLIALLPTGLGAKTAANSFPVTLATDGVASGISTQIGEVQTSPTANTILDRLKTINTTLGGLSVGGSGAGTSYVSDAIVTTRGANTTAYIAGDVYGTLFEITNFAEANKGFWLLNVNLVSSLSSLPSGMGSFKLFLFDSQPSTIADNGVFTLATTSITPQGIWLNNLSVITNATGATSQTDEINIMRIRGSGNLWGYIVTQSAFTPAASTADTLTMRFRGVSI